MRKTTPIDTSFFEKLTEATPAMIAVYNIQTGEYLYVNSSSKKILGYNASELVKGGIMFLSSLVHPDDLPLITEQNAKALQKANAQKVPSYSDELIAQFEYRMKHKNGTWRWLKTDGSVFERDSDGNVLCVLNISIDITDRKRAEEELYALTNCLEDKVEKRTEELGLSKERYEKLLRTISEGVWSTNTGTQGIQSSDWWFKVTGQTEKDANAKKGFGWLDVVHPDDKAKVKNKWDDAFKRGVYYEMAFRIKDKDGGYRTLAAKGVPLKKKNKIVEWIGTFHDITEKVKAREAQERAAYVLDSMAESYVSFDKKLRHLYINKQAERFLGKKREDVVGKSIEEVIPQIHISPMYKELKLVLKTKKPKKIEFFSEIFKKWLECRIYPTNFGVSFYLNDITDRKKLETQKEDFIAIAAHELRTPVTSLKAYAQVLKYRFEKSHDEKSQESVAKMDMQLTKLTSLINDLLDVSKIESGKLKFDKSNFSIDSLLEEMVSDVQLTTNAHKIIIKNKIGKKVRANYDRVGQVIVNLLSNAIKYSADNKRILVDVLEKNSMAQISVTDFGVGVPEKHQAHIFNRFYRVDGRKHDTYPGLGLGLYISQEIIKRLGGNLWIKSKEGKGSTFLFTLPLSK